MYFRLVPLLYYHCVIVGKKGGSNLNPKINSILHVVNTNSILVIQDATPVKIDLYILNETLKEIK